MALSTCTALDPRGARVSLGGANAPPAPPLKKKPGTLFKIQERKSDRRSREIEQRKELQNTHTNKTRTCDLNLLH